MSPQKEKIRTWVVDDNQHVRLNISLGFQESEEIECSLMFENCESALKSLKEKEDPPDAILLDIGLPGMSGIDGIKHFRRITPATKIIMLTVSDKTRDIHEAIKQGIDGYILKDSSFSIETVASAICKAMNGGTYLDPSVGTKIVEMYKSMSGPTVDYGFTNREKDVLELLADGLKYLEIAKKLRISYNTITVHVRNIRKKTHLKKETAIVAKAIKEHIV